MRIVYWWRIAAMMTTLYDVMLSRLAAPGRLSLELALACGTTLLSRTHVPSPSLEGK